MAKYLKCLILLFFIFVLVSCDNKHTCKYESTVQEVSCQSEGYTLYTCVVCGDSYKEDVVEKLKHDLQTYEIFKKPTETKEGKFKVICKSCDIFFETLPPLQSDFYDITSYRKPTCSREGQMFYTFKYEGWTVTFGVSVPKTSKELFSELYHCSDSVHFNYCICGEKWAPEEPHDFQDGVCIVCDTPQDLSYITYKEIKKEGNIGYEAIVKKGAPDTIFIPDEHNGYPVLSVDLLYIEDSKVIEKLVLPRKLMEIYYPKLGYGAGINNVYFKGSLSELLSVESKNSLVNPFDGVKNIYYIDGDGYKLLDNLVIPEDIFEVSNILSGYDGLHSIYISSNVRKIAEEAFEGCANVQSVVFDKDCKVTSLPAYCFAGMINLYSVKLSSGIKEVDSKAFISSNRLVELYTDNDIDLSKIHDFLCKHSYDYEDSCVKNIDDFIYHIGEKDNYLIDYIGEEKRILALPTDFEYIIRSNAFVSADYIYSIILGSNIKKIEKDAFLYCKNMIEIINNTKYTIYANPSSSAYPGDGRLGSYTYSVHTDTNESKLIFYGNYIFTMIDGRYHLIRCFERDYSEVIYLPEMDFDYTLNIAVQGFSMKKIYIPACVKDMADDCLSQCGNLEEIIFLGDEINSIDGISSCRNLKTITLPSKINIIKKLAFANSGLVEIVIPTNVNVIEEGIFFNCMSIEKITVPYVFDETFDYLFRATGQGYSVYWYEDLDEIIISGDRRAPENAFELLTNVQLIKYSNGEIIQSLIE